MNTCIYVINIGLYYEQKRHDFYINLIHAVYRVSLGTSSHAVTEDKTGEA